MKIHNISWEAELDLDLVNSSVQEAIASKRLFRYQFKDTDSHVNKLEKTIASYVNSNFALGVSSATNAIFLALKSVGVEQNSKVLIPSFTFTAVPSAVIQCGGEPVLVDITSEYVIDLEDLECKIVKSGAKYLLLSHMRGHLCDMDEVIRICKKYSIILIEDAAHALGVKWKGKHAGTYGLAGIYSLQSYKVINAGEGGLLVTNEADIFWKSVFMSGSYENNYLLHSNKGIDKAEKYINKLPVFNVRMNNITASLAIPQVKNIELKVEKTNKNYFRFIKLMAESSLITFPENQEEVRPVRDSVQMRIELNELLLVQLKEELQKAGIPISFFGGINNTNARLYTNWGFLNNSKHEVPNTTKYLSNVFDLRLPLHFTTENIDTIASVFLEVLKKISSGK